MKVLSIAAFIHEARLEPWGQTVARFMSPEGLLIGLSAKGTDLCVPLIPTGNFR